MRPACAGGDVRPAALHGGAHALSGGGGGAVCGGRAQVCQLQRLLFKHWPELKDLALSNCGTVERRETLRRALQVRAVRVLRSTLGTGLFSCR